MIRILALVLLSFMGCEKDSTTPCVKAPFDAYEWLSDMREDLKKFDTPASIVQYTYKGECVYLVNGCEGCPDAMSMVYNSDGKEICKFGGIVGFNTCPDFSEQATNEKVLYEQ